MLVGLVPLGLVVEVLAEPVVLRVVPEEPGPVLLLLVVVLVPSP